MTPALLLAMGLVPLVAPLQVDGDPPDPRREIRVLVVDREGRPAAGVPVGWRYSSEGLGVERLACATILDEQMLRTATTAVDGTVTLSEQRFREFQRGPLDVALAFPHRENVRAQVPQMSERGRPARLVLPITRRLEVEFVDEQARRVEGIGEVTISLFDPSYPEIEDPRGSTRFALDGGSLVVPFVGRGLLRFDGGIATRKIDARQGVAGPRRKAIEVIAEDARTTRVRVTTGTAGPTLHGRLFEVDGWTAGARDVALFTSSFRDGGSGERSGPTQPIAYLRSDRDGRFRVPVRPERGETWYVLALLDEFGGARFAAPICIDWHGYEEWIDAGDLHLVESKLLVAGRVVGAGAAVPGRDLLYPQGASFERFDRRSKQGQRLLALGALPQCQRWLDDGRFEVRSFWKCRSDDLLVGISGPFVSTPEQRHDRFVAVGARDVVLEVRRNGRIAGGVALPTGIDPAMLTCCVAGPDHAARAHDFLPLDGFPDDFEFRYVVPGPNDLVFGTLDALPSRAEVARIPGIEVPAGGCARDPRLAAFDLGDRLIVHDVQFVGTVNLPVGDGRLLGESIDRVANGVQLPIRSGRCRVAVVRGLESKTCAVAFVPGFAAKVLDGDDLARPVELAPACALHVTVVPWPLPADCAVVASGVVISDPTSPNCMHWPVEVRAAVSDAGTAELPIPCAGPWTLRIELDFGREGAPDATFPTAASTVTVRDGEAQTEAVLRYYASQLRAMADAVKRRSR